MDTDDCDGDEDTWNEYEGEEEEENDDEFDEDDELRKRALPVDGDPDFATARMLLYFIYFFLIEF